MKKLLRLLFFWKWWARFRCHRGLFPCALIDGPEYADKVPVEAREDIWKKWNK